MSIHFYCDMDGVLVDFVAGAVKKMNETIDLPNHPLRELAVFARDEIGDGPVEKKHLIKGSGFASSALRRYMRPLLQDDEEFWTNLPWIPGGREIWDSIKQHNPTILTSPMDQNGHQESIFGKQKWIKRELGLGTSERVIFSHDKYEHAVKGVTIGVLIDDYDKNINLFREHGGIAIHHKNNLSNTLNALEDIKNGYGSALGNINRGTETQGS